jgi:tetratricopeptide (TPR) repeat protein
MIRPDAAIRRIREVRERKPDDRKLEAIAAMAEALELSGQGRFEEGRALQRHGHQILEELGQTMWAAGMQYNAGRIEMVAGDLAAAEREFRQGIEVLESIGEQGYLSTQAAELGRVLYAQGRFEEAEEMAGVARRAGAEDDISSEVPLRGLEATLLARRGEFDQAIAHAEGAVALVEASDFADILVDALTDLSEVYLLAGRPDDAKRPLLRAIEIVEEKGVVPLVERLRAKLEAIGR